MRFVDKIKAWILGKDLPNVTTFGDVATIPVGKDVTYKYLILSIPKAGTNMITQACGGDHKNMPYGSLVYESTPHDQTLDDLAKFSRLGRSHVSYHAAYEESFRLNKIRAIFLYRDPRDMLVSYYFWIKKLGLSGCSIPGIFTSVDEILTSKTPFDDMIPVWGKHIRRYVPWIFTPSVLSVRYEDLIADRKLWLDKIAEFWGKPFGPGVEMSRRINKHTCNTFRKGKVGDWKNHFSDSTIKLFNDELGETMKVMGYYK